MILPLTRWFSISPSHYKLPPSLKAPSPLETRRDTEREREREREIGRERVERETKGNPNR